MTWALILVTIGQFAASLAVPEFDLALALPASDAGPAGYLGHAFAHGGVGHLLGNLLMLWVFGDNVEDAMGHGRFLAFYLATAAVGGAVWQVGAPADAILIGASGAVSGVMAAYLLLHPRARILVLLLVKVPVLVPASWAVGASILANLVMILAGVGEQVAWWAHIGGFAAGFLLLPVMKARDVPLLAPVQVDDGAEFRWLRRVLIDFSPRRAADVGEPASRSRDDFWALAGKALLYLVLLALADRYL